MPMWTGIRTRHLALTLYSGSRDRKTCILGLFGLPWTLPVSALLEKRQYRVLDLCLFTFTSRGHTRSCTPIPTHQYQHGHRWHCNATRATQVPAMGKLWGFPTIGGFPGPKCRSIHQHSLHQLITDGLFILSPGRPCIAIFDITNRDPVYETLESHSRATNSSDAEIRLPTN